jgi:hypothetical protein
VQIAEASNVKIIRTLSVSVALFVPDAVGCSSTPPFAPSNDNLSILNEQTVLAEGDRIVTCTITHFSKHAIS